MKNAFFSTLILFVFAMFHQTLGAQTAADEQSLRTFFDDVIQSWYAADADKVAKVYAENAVSIDWTGERLNGRQAIREDLAQVFAQEKPDPANFKMTVSEVRFLSPQVVVVLAELNGKSVMDGNPFEWQALTTLVLTRKTGAWQVEFEQNTPVMPQQSK